jgi:hypothetical protein
MGSVGLRQCGKEKKTKGDNPGRKAEKARRSMDIWGKSAAFHRGQTSGHLA